MNRTSGLSSAPKNNPPVLFAIQTCRTVRQYTSTPVHCYIRRDDLQKPGKNQIAIWSWPECSRWGAGACVRARKPYFSRSSLTFANTCCV